MDLTTVDKLLTTTRNVRKRLDLKRPVELEIIKHCLEIAIQAPTDGNSQSWRFIVITDAQKRASVATLYKKSFDNFLSELGENPPDNPQMKRVVESAIYLSEHMSEVPVLIIPCVDGRVDNPLPAAQSGLYGSIHQATWSLMLALRARGLGSAWTDLHLQFEKEVGDILDIPNNITQASLIPVAYYIGDDFKQAKRVPATKITYWDRWGAQA